MIGSGDVTAGVVEAGEGNLVQLQASGLQSPDHRQSLLLISSIHASAYQPAIMSLMCASVL